MAGTSWNVFINDLGTLTELIDADEVNANFDWSEGGLIPHLAGTTNTALAYTLGTSTAKWGNVYTDKIETGFKVFSSSGDSLFHILYPTAQSGYIQFVEGTITSQKMTLLYSDLSDYGVLTTIGTEPLLLGANNAETARVTDETFKVGTADYDRFEIADDGTSRGTLSKNGIDDNLNVFFNAYFDGAWKSFDSTRHGARIRLFGSTTDANFSWQVAQPTSVPAFVEIMGLGEAGTLQVATLSATTANVDTLTADIATVNTLLVGDTDYDRLEIGDDGTSRGALSKNASDNSLFVMWNAYRDAGGTYTSYDSTRHSWRQIFTGSTTDALVQWEVAQPTAIPIFVEAMRLGEAGTLQVITLSATTADVGTLKVSGDSTFGGGQIVKYTQTNAESLAMTTSDYLVGVITTANTTATITLPTATAAGTGAVYIVKDEAGNASAKALTIATPGAETIDGAAAATISANYDSISLYCNGVNYFIY